MDPLQTISGEAGPEALADYWPVIERAGWFFAGALVVLLVGWYLVEPVIDRAVRRRNQNNPTLQEAVSRYFRLLVAIIAVFVGGSIAGYGQFLTNSAIVVAAATLAVGVAGQTVIGSLISGLVLVHDPEFNVGNYIEWSGGEGVVRSITLRVTRVQTLNGELVTIPNTELTGKAITRPYGRGRYRVVEPIALAYEDDVDAAIEHLEAAAADVEEIQNEPEPSAYVDELGGDAVIIHVHYWVEDPRRRDLYGIRSAYVRAAKTRLDAAGITIAPPAKRNLSGRVEVDGAA